MSIIQEMTTLDWCEIGQLRCSKSTSFAHCGWGCCTVVDLHETLLLLLHLAAIHNASHRRVVMSLHAFWGPSRSSTTRSLSVTSSSRQSTDPSEPIPSTEQTPGVEQPLHRSTCPPHSLSFPIDWGVLRRHDGTITKGIQYRIRDKRNVGRRVKVSWIYSYGAELEHSNDKYFLCADCHTKKRYTSQLFAAESTTAAIQHLLEFHKIKRPSNSTTGDDDIDATNAAEVFQLIMPFNEDEYKQKLIDWAIKEPCQI